MSLAARYLQLLALSLPLSACGSEADPGTPQPRQPAIDRNLPTVTEQPADLPGYNVYRPADLDATGAPLPVIVWANGGCAYSAQPGHSFRRLGHRFRNTWALRKRSVATTA